MRHGAVQRAAAGAPAIKVLQERSLATPQQFSPTTGYPEPLIMNFPSEIAVFPPFLSSSHLFLVSVSYEKQPPGKSMHTYTHKPTLKYIFVINNNQF